MAKAPKMFARIAKPEDRDAFLELARLFVAESRAKVEFDQGVASYTFAGLARTDPAIHLLQDGKEIVGFMLLRMRRMPFCEASVWQQEELFIRADKRSAEAEAMLLNLMLAAVSYMKPAETRLMIQPGADISQVYEHLCALGCEPAGAIISLVGEADVGHREPVKHVDPPTLN